MENNFTCIIVDDEFHAAELLSDSIQLLFPEIPITDVYSTWQTALNALKSHIYDVVFMDISMPGKSGMDLLKLLPDLGSEIIFVTAYPEYALKAFEFFATGYLRKPVDDAELSVVMLRALKRVLNKRQAEQHKNNLNAGPRQLGIPDSKGVNFININDIIYLESINKCTKVVTRNGTLLSTNYLGQFKELIDHSSFFQVHRSFIINLTCMTRYESEGTIIMIDKRNIPVSRNNRSEFLKISNIFSRYRGDEPR